MTLSRSIHPFKCDSISCEPTKMLHLPCFLLSFQEAHNKLIQPHQIFSTSITSDPLPATFTTRPVVVACA
jgi:hypothetical protein